MPRILLALFLLFPLLLWSQEGEKKSLEDCPLRLEIRADSDKETYRIIPCGEHGMILFYQSVERTSDNAAKWFFSFYDQHLQQVWVKSAPVDASLSFKDVYRSHDTLHLFFESTEKKKNRTLDFQILRIYLASGKVILNNGTVKRPSSMVDFFVKDQKAYLGMNAEEGNAWIMMLDLPTGNSADIVVEPDVPSVLTFLGYDSINNGLLVMVKQQRSKTTNAHLFLRMDLQGIERQRSVITQDDSRVQMDNDRVIATSPKTVLIAGSYTRGGHSKKIKEDETTGLYITTVDQEKQGKFRLINFLDLKNIRDLLNERDILSLRKKSIKNQRSGNDYSLDLSLVMHDLILWHDTYLLAMETYYPQFHAESYTDYDFYGRPFSNSYNVFDGYRFTGFILVAFDREGEIIWDNVMDFRNLISFSLEPKVAVFPWQQEIILAYLDEGKIASKIISGETTIEKTSYTDLMLMTPNEKLLTETKSQMVYWYNDFFLCYGYQEIRDISMTPSEKRLVFFCNKVKFER